MQGCRRSLAGSTATESDRTWFPNRHPDPAIIFTATCRNAISPDVGSTFLHKPTECSKGNSVSVVHCLAVFSGEVQLKSVNASGKAAKFGRLTLSSPFFLTKIGWLVGTHRLTFTF